MDRRRSGQSLRRITLRNRAPGKSFGLIILIHIRRRTLTTRILIRIHIHTATTHELLTVSSFKTGQSRGDSLNRVPSFIAGQDCFEKTSALLYYFQVSAN
jgi:hypothetical protein